MWMLLFDVCLVLGSDVSSDDHWDHKVNSFRKEKSDTIRNEANDDQEHI